MIVVDPEINVRCKKHSLLLVLLCCFRLFQGGLTCKESDVFAQFKIF